MEETKITYDALVGKYNDQIKKNLAQKRKIGHLERENEFLHKCLIVLTLAFMALTILIGVMK